MRPGDEVILPPDDQGPSVFCSLDRPEYPPKFRKYVLKYFDNNVRGKGERSPDIAQEIEHCRRLFKPDVRKTKAVLCHDHIVAESKMPMTPEMLAYRAAFEWDFMDWVYQHIASGDIAFARRLLWAMEHTEKPSNARETAMHLYMEVVEQNKRPKTRAGFYRLLEQKLDAQKTPRPDDLSKVLHAIGLKDAWPI